MILFLIILDEHLFKYYNYIGDVMEIKNIKKLKSGKYKIELDGNNKILTYDDVIINNNLLYKKNIDHDLLENINIETSYYDIYTKVLKYISIKMRSKKEIIEYLNKNKVEKNDQEKIIDHLTKSGLLDDEMFAKAFVSDKIFLSNIGRLKIKKELLDHDINIDIIDKIIYTYSDDVFEEKLTKLMKKKIKNSKYNGYLLKQKIFYEFNNLGYENELISKVYDSIDIISNINKDFDKYYNILSKKYNGVELKNKLKNKLYSRGYSIDDINSIINTI